MHARGLAGVMTLAAVVVITVAWWALALWPVGEAPAWLERARYVCFGTAPNGLPDAAGWMALLLQPTLMLATVWVIWGRSLLDGLATLQQWRAGRAALRLTCIVLLLGLSAATWRVGGALRADRDVTLDDRGALPASYPRLDRPAPPLGLVDQHGDTITLDRYSGQIVLVTFAFAHCETVCPAIVRDVLEARRKLAATLPVAAVIVTLDPWRDVPSRLPSVASRWQLGTREHALSGSVDEVQAQLDAWGVPRQRNARTGDVTHPALAYIVDRGGTIAYAVRGGAGALVDLVGRL